MIIDDYWIDKARARIPNKSDSRELEEMIEKYISAANSNNYKLAIIYENAINIVATGSPVDNAKRWLKAELRSNKIKA